MATVETGPTIGANSVPLLHSTDMQCIVKQGWGFQWRGCVAHLTSGDDSKAFEDSYIIRSWWNSHSGMIFLAGDLNLNRNQTNPVFPNRWDIDAAHMDHTALMYTPSDHRLEEKIDYVYGRPSFFGGPEWGVRHCDAGYSDHCYLFGGHFT